MRATLSVGFAFLVLLAPGTGALAQDARDGDPWFRSGREAVAKTRAAVPRTGTAKNLVLFVGDGMGPTTVTAARIHEGQLLGGSGEEHFLSFERLPHLAMAKTYNTNLQVPDSAGTMTAIVSGVKTKGGVIGVGEAVVPGDHASVAASRVATLCEEAEARGMRTGVVSTARITHATPAACYGHVPSRDWEDDAELSDEARKADFPDLARQLVEFPAGDGIDVAMGGGRAHFLGKNQSDPEDTDKKGTRWDERNLIAEWQAAKPGRAYVWKSEQLDALDPTEPTALLGLFDRSHMEWELDRASDAAGEPSLSEMTRVALAFLMRDDTGFVLIVEAGRIDHGHHAGNAARALTDAVELSRAVTVALETVSLDDTLVIVTADHGHTLSFSGYPTRGNPILGKVVTNDRKTGAPATEPMKDGLGRPFTTLSYANGPGYEYAASAQQPLGPKRFPHFPVPGTWKPGAAPPPDLADVDTTAPNHLQSATVPMIAETHGGQDVGVYAGGPGSELFRGTVEQHYIYHAIVDALDWNAGTKAP